MAETRALEKRFRVTHALCRKLPTSFEDSLKLEPPPEPIDVSVAHAQHDRYVELLRSLGLVVKEIDADNACPDCVFVEDTALMVASGTAIISLPGAPSRQGETPPVEQAMLSLGLPRIARLEPPATLDGGDVLCLGWAILVGLSQRTNQAAVDQLTRLMEELAGPPVFAFQVRGDRTLHFKSVLSAVDVETLVVHDGPTGRDLEEQILAVPELVGRLRVVRVPDVAASNVLSINEHLVMQSGYPDSEAVLRGAAEARGMTLHTLCMAELGKADGALTCCSLLFEWEGGQKGQREGQG